MSAFPLKLDLVKPQVIARRAPESVIYGAPGRHGDSAPHSPQTAHHTSTQADGSHIPVLDGVRGVAIVLVLFHHFTLYAGVRPAAYIDKIYYKLAEASWCGVDLFFVLSGFLITGILLKTKARPNYFRNFYTRRCLRIFPLYYGTLAVLFWVVPLLVTPSGGFATVLRERGWYWSYLANVLYARQGWPEFDGIGHVWSLAVEEQFYLMWPLLIFWTRRRTLIAACLGAVVGSFLIRLWLASHDHRIAAYVLMPARTDALAVGALLAILSTSAQGLAARSRYLTPLAVLAASGIAAVGLRARDLNAERFLVVTVVVTCLAILFGAVLALVLNAAPGSRTSRVLSSRVLTFFGRYSYGLYVLHSPLLFLMLRPHFSGASVPPIHGSVLPGVLLFATFGIGLSILLALVSWHLWERPFLELKRHFV